MPLRVRSGFLGAAGPTGGGLSTEAECGIIGGKTGPDTGKGVTDAVLSLYLAALESDGDKKQFRELYRRYHRVMERTALAVLHDPHDAEEAVQEAFLRVIENFSKIYEIPCKDLGGWLVIIVRNEAITILRRRRCPRRRAGRILPGKAGTCRTIRPWCSCLPGCRTPIGRCWR